MAHGRYMHVPSPSVEVPRTGPRPLPIAVASDDPACLQPIVNALRADGMHATTLGSFDEVVDGGADAGALILGLDLTAPASSRRLRQLRELHHAAITVVSRALTPIGIRRALDAGVEGLVLERDVERALVPTLMSVAAGQIAVPRDAGPQLQGPALTARERQVLGMVALGFKNFEIGQKLYLAESTVKSHLSSAFSKLGVRSRSEAAALMLDTRAAREILSITSER